MPVAAQDGRPDFDLEPGWPVVAEGTKGRAGPDGEPGPVQASSGETCFVISPIGYAGSAERKHADLLLSALIEPALANLGMRVVRGDKISAPGLITGQVIRHVCLSALVIADLSFANPNVCYELALRHALRKPVVQIIRSSDTLPFDVAQIRTVTIDMTDIYTLVPNLDAHRQEILEQCRAALAGKGGTENPLSRFYPQFWDSANSAPDSHPESGPKSE